MLIILLDPFGDTATIFLIYFQRVEDITLTFLAAHLANEWNISFLQTKGRGSFFPDYVIMISYMRFSLKQTLSQDFGHKQFIKDMLLKKTVRRRRRRRIGKGTKWSKDDVSGKKSQAWPDPEGRLRAEITPHCFSTRKQTAELLYSITQLLVAVA